MSIPALIADIERLQEYTARKQREWQERQHERERWEQQRQERLEQQQQQEQKKQRERDEETLALIREAEEQHREFVQSKWRWLAWRLLGRRVSGSVEGSQKETIARAEGLDLHEGAEQAELRPRQHLVVSAAVGIGRRHTDRLD